MADSLRDTLGKFARLLPFIRGERGRLAGILLLSALLAGLAALVPWPLKVAVDVALGDAAAPAWIPAGIVSSPTGLIAGCALATAAILVLTVAVGNALTWLWAAAGHRMLYALAGALFERLQRMSLLFHVRQSTGDLLTRVTGDSWCVYQTTAALLVSPLRELLTIVAIGYAALSIDPLLTLAVCVLSPLLAYSVYRFGRPIRQRAKTQREAEAAFAGFAQQTLANVPIIQVFSLAGRNARLFDDIAHRLTGAAQSLALTQHTFDLVNASALGVGVSAVLLLGGLKVAGGTLTVGSLLVFMAYVETLKMAFQTLLTSYGQLRAIEASVDRVNAILDQSPDVVDRPHAAPLRLVGRGGARIDFDQVSFSYDGLRPAVQALSLSIAAGEMVALVGETGAGKSTIAGLVPRFFDPDEGMLRIDGQDLREVTLHSLRGKMALVLQDPFLLPVSIADNIAFGRVDATQDQIRAAALAANAHGFIEALPSGYDTVIGERGATLSGGQRQRLAIARALVRDAPILILDEPTSALDPETEAAILDALDRLMTGRTTIVIAHRLSTVARADRIAVIEKGRIVELGSRDELLARRGRYWTFETLQGPSKLLGVPA